MYRYMIWIGFIWLYIVFVTWPLISPECFKASSLEGFFSQNQNEMTSAWRMGSYTLGGLFVTILLGITHMFRHHPPSSWISELFLPRVSRLFSDFTTFPDVFLVQESALVGTHSNFSNAGSDQCPSIRRSWQLPAEP